MATTVVLKSVIKDPPPSTKCRVNFADGSGHEFNSLADVQSWARDVDLDALLTQRMCVAYVLARSSDLSNINTVKDKNFTFDLSNPSPIKVQ